MRMFTFPALDSFAYRYGKQIFDLVVATPLLLLILLPFTPVVALLIWFDDCEGSFYSQERIGRYGKPFRMWKFRSMRTTPDHLTRPASACDQRSSSLGRSLRLAGIDELPQLWNVVRGDMSLIGPRPGRALFVKKLSRSIPHYACRHAARGGISGLSQIEGLRGSTAYKPESDATYTTCNIGA